MGSYKKIGLSHEMGLIDTPPFQLLDIMGHLFLLRYSPNLILCYRKKGKCEATSFHDTVEFQWLEHLWDHENMFATGVVRANAC